MRQSRFTEEQRLAILNRAGNEVSVAGLTKKLDISESTFYS